MRALFASAGVPMAPEDWAFFERLRLSIVAGNAAMNLTRLVEAPDFYRKHVLDAALPFFVVPKLRALGDGLLVVDVGSGAGFPGLVLARLRPTWDVGLVERTRKKADFLERAIAELRLENAFVVPMDAKEAAAQAPLLSRKCDLVVARAVGRIAEVTRDAARFLRRGGMLVHYKGGDPPEDELLEGAGTAEALDMRQEAPFRYDLPPDAKRSVVIVVNRSTGRTRSEGTRPTLARPGSRGGRAR